MWLLSTVCFKFLLKCWWGNLHIQSGGFCASICWPSTQIGQVCQFVTMLMNDVMVTLLHLSLTSNNICLNSPINVMVTMIHLLSTANNICLNSPMQATNPSTPIKHFNTMLPAGKYEKRGTYFQTSKIACKGLYYKLMEILTNFEFPRQIIKFGNLYTLFVEPDIQIVLMIMLINDNICWNSVKKTQ